MSAKTVLGEILGLFLVAGEQLTPVLVHNPKSQQIITILTPDVNALFTQLFAQGTMAQPVTTAPAGTATTETATAA